MPRRMETSNHIMTPLQMIPVANNIADVIRIVSDAYSISPKAITGRERQKSVALARHVAMYLCRTRLHLSLHTIGSAFERDHGTVFHATKRIRDAVETEPKLAAFIEGLAGKLNGGSEGDLLAENRRLRKAFHDAIRRPMGIVPASGDEFYNAKDDSR